MDHIEHKMETMRNTSIQQRRVPGDREMSPVTALAEEIVRAAAVKWLIPSLRHSIHEAVLLAMALRGWQ